MANIRLVDAEKSAIQRSASQGLVSVHTAESMLAAADNRLDKLMRARSREPQETDPERPNG
jgi:hypothetical protein